MTYGKDVFNPASRDHIADRLKVIHGWEPTEFTNSGKPKVDEEVLSSLEYPEAKLLVESLLINKRIGQLATGTNAWLKLVQNGKIHGRVNTNGCATHRCTHSKPNVQNAICWCTLRVRVQSLISRATGLCPYWRGP